MFSEKKSTELEDKMDLEVTHNKVIESIYNEYTGYNINASIDDGGRADIETTKDCNTQPNKDLLVLPLSINDVFTEGRKK